MNHFLQEHLALCSEYETDGWVLVVSVVFQYQTLNLTTTYAKDMCG